MRAYLSSRWLPAESLLEMMAMSAVATLVLCLLIWLHLM
jgi:hypothetical protein